MLGRLCICMSPSYESWSNTSLYMVALSYYCMLTLRKQATSWAQEYSTLGYLVGIITVLSLPTQPRAKFLQSMLAQIIMSCVGGAFTVLGCYCVIRARANTEGNSSSGTSGIASSGAATTTNFNASASAVAVVWLFLEIFILSVIRAFLPQYAIPTVMWVSLLAYYHF